MTADFLLSLAQAITKGLLTGMVYGLMALGLSVIFGVMRVVNFAHGELMVVGMYLAWMGFEYLQVSPMLSLPVIAAVFFVAGYALQRTVISPFIGRPEHQQFLLLLAIAILLVNACLAIAGPDSRGVQLESQFDSYELGPLVFDAVRLHAALTAVVIAALLWLFFTRTRIGKSIRAAADNHMGALVVGLDVRRLYAFTFGVGAACVGAAGALMITIIPVTPFLAAEYTLLAFVIVIVGGLGSMTGALLGGLLIGVSEAVAGLLLQPSLKSMVSFGILILVLLLRPQGLMGKRGQ
ncbi:MAG: branched-chain amino acid ABC transporter permease [Reyranella sp.]|jgi:branched-chain amino acid transport system permease protein|uniref:branched-chain amino acid ABC transporter permease n=1 Tax=Reyranella sp. TaxID=1929291 RepID=UPI0009632A89|nr:branched-chain amino acid ABC transporter permease [Reyranella sp.]MBN9537293.1 branched-chain amino acid ABC transporter permease [Alphaproteobacteria bacterium]MBR2814571.1 branched-chain amino acid ABC transporter permease [Reyranella sp.]OJU32434.1 MAG: branched-chain amino acid ABC transporter permease [Alphaproteobacteria bacterium 65-37]